MKVTATSTDESGRCLAEASRNTHAALALVHYVPDGSIVAKEIERARDQLLRAHRALLEALGKVEAHAKTKASATPAALGEIK